MSGHIYIVHLQEFVNNGDPIFKVGHTTRNIADHLQGYPKGSRLLFSHYVDNAKAMETSLLDKLRSTFYNARRYGQGYFEGDCSYFLGTVCSHVNDKTSTGSIKASTEDPDPEDESECTEAESECNEDENEAEDEDPDSDDKDIASASSSVTEETTPKPPKKITDPTLTVAAFMDTFRTSYKHFSISHLIFKDFKDWCAFNASTIGAQNVSHGKFVSTLMELYGVKVRLERLQTGLQQVLDFTDSTRT